MSDRTFKVGSKLMEGPDVRAWQEDVKHLFKKMMINCPIVIDGVYGVHTRSYTASLCRAMGLESAEKAMAEGITPELRIKLRNERLTEAEEQRRQSESRREYRRDLRERWAPRKVHKPVSVILADSWGYHPPVHDGLDVICNPNAAVYAMVKAKVFDVRASGWWGKAPSGDVSKGDGIVQIEVLENVGPFRKGFHIGYGHCEHARVSEGEIVQAGEVLALAGLAVAWHVHLMYNDGSTTRGVGNRDPRAILDYTKKHG
jgi:murein DD-endopeptidase MepM/ murein hydrolase activator NlpD